MSRQSAFLYTVLGVVVSVTAAAGGVRGQALLGLIVATGLLAVFGHWLMNRVVDTDVQEVLDSAVLDATVSVIREQQTKGPALRVPPVGDGPHLAVAFGTLKEESFWPIRPAGASLPCRGQWSLGTSRAGQQSVQVELLIYVEPEATVAPLTTVTAFGLPPGPPGAHTVQFLFQVSQKGQLSCRARSQSSEAELAVEVAGAPVLLQIASETLSG